MLLIASMKSDLPNIQAEIMEAVNELGADVVLAEDGVSVASALARKKYKTVWFAGHGNEDGIWLSPSYCIDAWTLAPSLRDRGIELIVLNTCNSESLAYALHAQTRATVVFTQAEVQDDAAFAVAKRFFCELKDGASYHEAFDTSKSRHFQIIDGYPMANLTEEKLDKIISLFHDLDKRISIIETRLEIRGAGRDKWYWLIVIVGLVLSAALFLWLWGDTANGWFAAKDYRSYSVPGMGGHLSVLFRTRHW